FLFTSTAPTQIYTLSLHDALPILWFHDSYFERDAVTYASAVASQVEDIAIGLGALNPFTRHPVLIAMTVSALDEMAPSRIRLGRSEEHTSELQSRENLVCRLLLEK